MPRGSRKNGHAPETAEQTEDRAVSALKAGAGSNVSDATLREHLGRIMRLEEKMASVRQELSTAYENAEKSGIERKPFKDAMKLLKKDPATADAYLRKLNQYTQQLGLLDRIADWKSAEEREANAASADVAERPKGTRKPKAEKKPEGEPENGGAKEAAYAQGYEAGGTAISRTVNPYTDGEKEEAWFAGFDAGRLAKVDTANSERYAESHA